MPVNVRITSLQTALVLLSLLCVPEFQPLVRAQDESAKSSEGETATGSADGADAGADPISGQTGTLPDDPAEAYQVTQRRAVQKLQRMNNGLVTPEIITAYTKHFRDYRTLIRMGTNGRIPREMEILRAGLNYRVFQLSEQSIQQNQIDLENALKTIRREISQAGSGINNAQQQLQFRELMFKEMLPLLRQLLKNNLIARSCAIEILPDMEVVRNGPQGRITMFDQVDDVLVEVLNDPKQPNAIKLRALNSITNYLQKLNAIPQIQMSFAKAIDAQLKLPYTSVPYQEFLLVALEEITAAREVVAPKRPLVFETAVSVMQDPKRNLGIRCHAAAVLGRAGSDAQINMEPLAWAVADLTGEVGATMFKGGNAKPFTWNFCGYHLFRAYRHWDPKEEEGGSPGYPKGFLNRDARSDMIRSAWEAAAPVIVGLVEENRGTVTKGFLGLAKWLEGNAPTNLKYDAGAPPLTRPNRK